MKYIIIIVAILLCGHLYFRQVSSDDPFISEIIEIMVENGYPVRNKKVISCFEKHSNELSDEEKSTLSLGFNKLFSALQQPVTDEKKLVAAKILSADPELSKAFTAFRNKLLTPCTPL